MEDKTMVVTMRVIDLANPVHGAWRIPCDECGELTWISSIWKNKKIDQVVCKPCWLTKYNDGDYVTCTTEEIIEQALEMLRGSGMDVTREELLKDMEFGIGRRIKVV